MVLKEFEKGVERRKKGMLERIQTLFKGFSPKKYLGFSGF